MGETDTKTSKYKIGDFVRIKNDEWYENNKGERGIVICGNIAFLKSMQKFCGRTVTIIDVDEVQNIYTAVLKKDYFSIENHTAEVMHLNDDMIEGFANCEPFGLRITNEMKNNITTVVTLPEGYEFKDENGCVINATKITVEKKHLKIPDTYEECRKELKNILGGTGVDGFYRRLDKDISELKKLIICRNAVYEILNWHPTGSIRQEKYHIKNACGFIVINKSDYDNHLLQFPTEEIAEKFYEKYKPLIMSCKEFL